MARKKPTSDRGALPSSEPAVSSKSDPAPSAPARDVIKANIANLTELKHTLDDALKRLLGGPEFYRTIYQHTDVRLALGWASVFVAAFTALYGWKFEFEAAKPVLWAGLMLYILLTSMHTLYVYFIEGDIVYVGKRKTFAKRIETERITIESRTKPSTPMQPPQYTLSMSYVRSSNNGKSLLHRGKAHAVRGYNAFFDEEGSLDQEAFEAWVRDLVARATGEKSE